MHRVRFMSDRYSKNGLELVDDIRHTLDLTEQENPILVNWDWDDNNSPAILVYEDGDKEWNLVMVKSGFDIKMYTADPEGDAFLGYNVFAIEHLDLKRAQEILYLLGLMLGADVGRP